MLFLGISCISLVSKRALFVLIENILIVCYIVFIPYPPVGSATCATLALASYLFYVGIYSSAISISEDAELRRSIRRTAENELKLLDSIGTTQMNVQLQDKVTRLVKEYADKMTGEAGVHPYLSQEDAKQYLEEVMKELDKNRRIELSMLKRSRIKHVKTK